MCGNPHENKVKEFVPDSPAESNISNLSFLDGLWDGLQVAIQRQFFGAVSKICLKQHLAFFRISHFFSKIFINALVV